MNVTGVNSRVEGITGIITAITNFIGIIVEKLTPRTIFMILIIVLIFWSYWMANKEIEKRRTLLGYNRKL